MNTNTSKLAKNGELQIIKMKKISVKNLITTYKTSKVTMKYSRSLIPFGSPKSKKGQTRLHLAAEKGDILVYKNLSKNKSNKNPKNARGWTPLHIAAEKGNFELFAFIASLIDDRNPKASFEAKNWTPLHCAARNGHFEIVQFICSIVEDIYPKDTNQKTPRNIAQINGKSEICDLYMKIWLNGRHSISNYYFKTYADLSNLIKIKV